MSDAVTAAYDTRSAEYVEILGSVDQMADEDRRTITAWRDRVSGPIVDAGCGPGHWTDLLAKGGDPRVVGLDASAAMLASARARFSRITCARADLGHLPFADGSVGGVLAWYSVIHAEAAELPRILGEVARVLRPGGSLLLGFFDGPAGAPFDHAVARARWWSVTALTELMAPHGLVLERSASRQDPGVRRHGEIVAIREPVA